MFRRYRFVSQDSREDCGVACLLSMIKRYGGDSNLEDLRRRTKTTKEGTTAYHLIESAKEMGFDAAGYRGELNDLNPPFIAHIIKDNLYHHFVIIESFNQNRVLVNDPAIGIKNYKIDEFLRVWSHIGIVLLPKENMVKEKNQRLFLKEIIGILKQYPKYFIAVFVLSMFYVVLSVIGAYYLKLVFDHFGNPFELQPLFLLFLFVTVFKVILEYVRNIIQIKLSKQIDQDLLSITIHHMMKLPYDYYSKRYKGDLLEKLNQLSHIREFFSKLFSIVFVDVFILLLTGFILIQIQLQLFCVLLLMVVLYFLFSVQYHSKYRIQYKEITSKASLLSQVFMESLSGMESMKGLHLEEEIIGLINNKYHQYLDVNSKLERIYSKSTFYKNLVMGLGTIVILYASTFFRIEFGNVLIFYSISIYFLESCKNIFDFESTLRMAFHSISRMNDMFSVEKEGFENGNCIIKGQIEAKELFYSYDDIHPVIDHVSFEIKPKEKVYITGPSGCGKSTLMKLIMKYIGVQNHQLWIDQKDINSYRLGDIRSELSYVPQEEVLFLDSLYQNIVMYRNVKEETFHEICKITRVDEIIRKYHGNPYVLIEDGGSNLSGGERQRIMLARALIKPASIYLFDESMSKMDATLERDITKSLLEYLKEQTVLFISHSNHTRDLFDKEIKLERKENL